jgi:hypothetical protein
VATALLIVGLLVIPGVLYAQGAGLKPGDSVGTMSLRSGGAEHGIWAEYCAPMFGIPPIVEECSVPALPELGIGPGCFFADEALREAAWPLHLWELYLDGQQINLDPFGTLDLSFPMTRLPGRDPDEAVVVHLRTWDVVLVNPTVGEHVLRVVARFNEQMNNGFVAFQPGTYELIANFTVEAPTLPVTGRAASTTLPTLWLWTGGLLLVAAGLVWRRAVRRA